MLNRILVSLFWIPLLVVVILYGKLPFLILATGITLIAQYEFYSMSKNKGYRPLLVLGLLVGGALPIATYFNGVYDPSASVNITHFIIFLLFTSGSYKVFTGDTDRGVPDIAITVFGFAYIPLFFSFILLISQLQGGGRLVLATQALVWTCDIAAYFSGLKFGRKIFSRGLSPVSPKKSIEGSLGAIFFTILAGIILKYTLLLGVGLSFGNIIIFSIIVSTVGQVGDLFESLIKRHFEIKDSGTILGEHGGILDRFDSMIFVLPVIYFFLTNIVKLG